MNESFFLKSYLLRQDPVDGASQRSPMHFSGKSPQQPSLEKAAGNAVTNLESFHGRTDRNNLPRSIGYGHPGCLWIAVIPTRKHHKVTIVERGGPHPNNNVPFARKQIGNLDKLQSL